MIEFDELAKLVVEGATKGLARGTKVVERRAKARAPVRNIFGHGYSFRTKTVSEMETGLRFVSTKALGEMQDGDIGKFMETVATEEYRTTGKRRQQRDWHQRRTTAVGKLLADYDDDPSTSPLTRQGAHEVRSKRAAFSTWGHSHTGGRLRGEIYSVMPQSTGDTAEAWVISPTDYAKYQEFGSRHNRAHPYLRPALEESRDEVVAQIAEAVREASSRNLSDIELEIVVRL